MLRKDEILERTNNGLNVFKHYISGTWRVGRNFLNPLYEDSKASCNIYFDRRSGIYKMKDFGNDDYSGDCFFFVGMLKGLDCNNSSSFIEILRIIDRDLSLGLSEGNPIPVPKTFKEPEKPVPVPVERTGRPYTFKERKLTASELEYWQQYGITSEILEQYKVCSVVQFQSENADGNPFSYSSTKEEPIYGYKNKRFIKLYRFPRPAFYMAEISAKAIVSGWNSYPVKAIPCLLRVGKKMSFRLPQKVFMRFVSIAKR